MNINNTDQPLLVTVVPCFNEESVLNTSSKKLGDKMISLIKRNLINKDSYILFVNDGSHDSTKEIIQVLNKSNSIFKGISLSKNFGHQNALTAGLHYVTNKCDISISLDSDLQDDIDVIDKFIKEYKNGNHVVYGVRKSRKRDTFFKKTTAETYYKVLNFLGINVVYNHADYRLVSNTVLNSFKDFGEYNLYLRGIFPMIGYKSSVVHYNRGERFAGDSKYNLIKMLSFAWDGISSFSSVPLRVISIISILILILSFFVGVYALRSWYIGNIVTGWTSLLLVISFLGGLQMLAIGVIGEYIAKVYQEIKKRPRYIVENEIL
jgi:polyisoprenyl-phosphate glycosyltransferase